MEKLVLYSTHCPKCKILEMKLKKANLPYSLHDDIEEMTKLNIKSAPVLDIGDKLLGFADAVKYINEL